MTTSLELQHFAILELSQHPRPASIIVSCLTNNPCHLTCYYTAKEPVRHRTSLVKRGVALPWGAYFCFAAWNSVEQQEPGDTLIHTFEVPDWSYCQTKWISFRGTVAGEISPSVGPLIKKHYAFKIFQYLNVPWFAYWGSTSPDSRAAQTFTPQQPQTIASITLPLRRDGTPGTITISIRATDADGHPTGPDLTLGTIDGDTLPTAHPGEWRFFDLTPLLLDEYVKYAIVIKSQFASVMWPHVGGNQYPVGQLLTYTVATDTWNPTTRDFIFECWGTPIPAP